MGRKPKLTASSLDHASRLLTSSLRSCGCSFLRILALDEQRAVLALVRELEHDVGHPEARGPQRDCAVVDGHVSSGYEVVRAEEGEVLQ